MSSPLKKFARFFIRPIKKYFRPTQAGLLDDFFAGEDSDIEDSFIWHDDLERHCFGDLSFAVARGNEVIEDYSQVEIGNGTVFVGIYDGHGGVEASRFAADHLYNHFTRIASENGGFIEANLKRAFAETEEEFLELVRTEFRREPLIAAMGTCCLVGVISGGKLFTANLGDSRAVVGTLSRLNKIKARQVTEEHNARVESIRRELRFLHPDDSQIVSLTDSVWRVKGICQVSRAIGDAFLKDEDFSLNATEHSKYYLPERLTRPVISAIPSVSTRALRSKDKFVIFASDGLWDYLSNQEAVQIVRDNPRDGIARRLVMTVLNLAAQKHEMSYQRLRRTEGSAKRYLHDDITVIVLFIDHKLLTQAATVTQLSIRGFADAAGPSGDAAGPSGS